MTPEKILELLPKKLDCQYSGSNIDNECGLCNKKEECTEYGYNELLNDCANALAGKVVAKEDLLTVEETALLICKSLFEDNLDENKPVRNLHIYAVAKIIVDAQQRKANREKND
jgi:hypothetical protein